MSESTSPGPLVTIGLPVYNGEQYIAQSIECLLAQTFRDFVILISDNASIDRTSEICQQYASQDPRIRYHRNDSNVGMPGNYNLTFSMARSKYFRWATADDYCDREMLQDAVNVMEGDPSLALCYPRAIFVDENGKELYRWKDDLHLLQDDPASRFRAVVKHICRVHHHLGLMRTDCMRRTGLFAKHVSSDIGFVAEMSLYGKFYQIEKHQFFRRMHEDSSSWSTNDHRHQARTYHAARAGYLPFSRVRFHRRFVRAVRRSPLGLGDRLYLYAFLFAHAVSDRRRLTRESLKDLRWMFGRLVVPRGES